MKKITTLFLLVCISLIVSAEEYFNEEYLFSLSLPNDCQIVDYSAGDNYATFLVFNAVRLEPVAVISCYRAQQEDKIYDYRKMREIMLEKDSCRIIEEQPFYDLMRQDFTILHLQSPEVYEKVLLKARSYITIRCPYPLSEETQTVINTFDNRTTFRGNLQRMKQNTGTILLTVFISLLAFVGYRSRKNRHSTLFIVISLIMFAMIVVCMWQNIPVMLFSLSVSLLIWLFFFSHNKYLIWLINSIFG